jgi:hypothetical protein
MAEENLPGPGLAISDKGGLCRVFSPAAPISVVQGTVVGTARQNISTVGCSRLPFRTASRSVRVLVKVPYLHYFSPLPRPSLDEKTRCITVPVRCARAGADLKALSGGQDQLHRLTSLLAHRGGLHQGKAHWLDLPLQPLPPCIKRRAAYSVLLTERLSRLPTLLLTGNQLAPVLPSLRHPLLVAQATTMRPSTPCGLVVFIGCLRKSRIYDAPVTAKSSGVPVVGRLAIAFCALLSQHSGEAMVSCLRSSIPRTAMSR